MKRTRMKNEVRIQKRLPAEQCGLSLDAEVWVDVTVTDPMPTTVKAKSVLNGMEKKLGDEYRIIGVKQVYRAATREVVFFRAMKEKEPAIGGT